MLWPTLAVLLSLLALVVVIVALQVDDWRRDLTTNTASTSDDPRSALPAHHSELAPAELARHVLSVIDKLPRWRLAKLTEGDGQVTLHLVRSTPLLRFQDDITVAISPEPTGSILRAVSQSRVGKGDLGQNPRNLRELLSALKSSHD